MRAASFVSQRNWCWLCAALSSGLRQLRGILIVTGFSIATFISPTSAPAAVIDWQVDNPFRFFRYGSDFEIHRWAYNELSAEDKQQHPVSALERKLNDPRWWKEAGLDGTSRLAAIRGLRRAEGRRLPDHDARLGWSSLLLRDTNDTCWNPSTQLHRDCASRTINVTSTSTYLDPKAHRGTAWVRGGQATAACRWSADSAVFIDRARPGTPAKADRTAPCNERVSLLIPSDKELQLKVTGDGSGDGEENVSVQNLLIVGLGDSMSSGEGNPDVAVRLHPNQPVAPAYDDRTILSDQRNFDYRLGVPRREDPNRAAGWVDRRCHRSLYSWQLRAALGVALTEPQHRAVTFVSFACSGSEILEGLLYPWEGREVISPSALQSGGSGRLKRPQIDAVVDELCRDRASNPREFQTNGSLNPVDDWVVKHRIPVDRVSLRSCPKEKMRPIDLLFMSIGINDVGFSGIIANMMVTNGTTESCHSGQVCYSADFIRSQAGVVDFDTARSKLDYLRARFAVLHSVIKDRLKLRGDDLGRIMFAAYPPLVSATPNGHNCPTGRQTMTISEIFEVKTNATITDADRFTEHDLVPRLREYVTPWTFVSDHRTAFVGHGYCAVTNSGPNESGKHTAEITAMPYMRLVSGPGFGDWQFYSPVSDLYPYESRARWFRTFNDDYMIINYAKRRPAFLGDAGEFSNPIDLAQSPKGGPMHPTAEGHAHISDAVTKAARQKLGLAH